MANVSLLDFASRVLTTYKADVDQHVRELGKLKGAEKDRAQATIDANKQASSSFEDQIKSIGKWGLALGAATAAAVIAWDGFKAAMERSRLEATAGAISLDRLKIATLGLKRESELLKDASLLQSGAFKLSQQQLEMVERAMLALTRRGFEVEKVHEGITHAVVGLQTDGLMPLGLHIDKTGLSMDKAADRAKIFERIMAELARTSEAVKDGQRSAAEGVEATAVSMQDSFEKMKIALGQLVIAMRPLLESLASAVGLVAKIAGAIPTSGVAGSVARTGMKLATLPATGVWGLIGLGGDALDALGGSSEPSAAYQKFQAGMDARAAGLAGQWGVMANPMSAYTPADLWGGNTSGQLSYTAVADLIRRFGPGAARFFAPPGTGEGGYTIGGYDYFTPRPDTADHTFRGGLPLGESAGALGDKYGPGGELAPQGIFDATLSPGGRSDLTGEGLFKAFRDRQHKSFLEQSFGKLKDFNAYAKGFEMLTGAVTTAMTAWIQGSMSVGMAFKKFIGEALSALASQMAIEALKHGAYALGSLAFGDIRGAGQHGVAAAAFGAGAAAAAVAARAMGHGGTDYGKGAGAAAPTGGGRSGSSAGSGDNGRDVIIAYADPFANDSPRARQLEARRVVNSVLGSSGVKYQ